MKCRYKYCRYGGIVDKGNAVKVNKAYYHKECYEEMNNKKEIRDLWLNRVNPTETIVLLNKAINDLINKKKVDSSFVLYSLKYAINNKFELHSPFGMSYIVNNYKIKNEYQKSKAKLINKEVSTNIVDKEDSTFLYGIKTNKKGLMDKIKKSR